MTLHRVALVGWHVFKESVRDRVLYSIAVFGVLLVGASFAIGQITAGQDLKIIKDLGLATIELAGVLMTVFIGVGLVAREIDRRSIFALLAKPLPRWEFILGKYVGLVLTVTVNIWAMAAAFYLMLGWVHLVSPANLRMAWEAPALDPQLALQVVLFTAELALLTAIALFFSTFSSSALISVVFTVGCYVAGPGQRRPARFWRHRRRPATGIAARDGRRVARAGVLRIRRQERRRPRAPGPDRTRALDAPVCRGVLGDAGRRVGCGVFAPGIQVTGRLRGWYATGAVIAGLTLAAGVLHAREGWYPSRLPTERVLYLRSGKIADRLMLSFDAIAADVYWVRTIQHYGRDRRSGRSVGRFELLQPLLDLTTTLDPQFMIAYRFGAIFLATAPPDGPGRADQSIALLQKGLAANPTRWQLPYDIAFIHYWHTGDYAAAADWFEKAASLPNAPSWIRPLAATTKVRGGNREGARQMLVELASSSEEYIRRAAVHGLTQLKALEAIDELNRFIEAFRLARGRYPKDWLELFPQPPFDDTGAPFVYDETTHTARLSPSSRLAPLPVPLR